ncbi:hypothetical protein BDF19DRAFT_435133 [Syncephalis fuscata]|nr:hypothetical protein BDF19DRAFT_435133 [Syncephalis fuscata]
MDSQNNQAANAAALAQFSNAPFVVASISDAGFPVTPQNVEMHLIEQSENKRAWLTEEETWDLKRKGISFMDVTFHQDDFKKA